MSTRVTQKSHELRKAYQSGNCIVGQRTEFDGSPGARLVHAASSPPWAEARFKNHRTNPLTRGLSSGRLTQFEYNRLLSRYNELNALETQLRMGGLNFRERQRLSMRLNVLENQLQRDLRDRQFAGRPGRWY